MHQEMSAAGRILIELTANGFVVILPPKQVNPYQGMAPVFRAARGDEDPILEQAKDDAKPVERAYEMSSMGNVFVFKTFSQVLAFLDKKMKPVPDID